MAAWKALRLNAAEREHEPTAALHQSAPSAMGAGNVETGDDLAAGAELDAGTSIDSAQGVMNEIQSLPHRHAEVVGKRERRRAGVSSLPPITMKSGWMLVASSKTPASLALREESRLGPPPRCTTFW